jgi:GT2 family glycosyltransferase
VGGSSGYYDTAVYPVYRRNALIDIGLFNESLKRNQDNDLNQRLHRAGWKIWMDSEMKAEYYCRNSLKSLMRQMYGNGRYIAEVIR